MGQRDFFQGKQILMDGAMGTYYGEKFQRVGKNPELLNRKHPERILQIHREYLHAGARLLRSNSFSSNLDTLFGKVEGEEEEAVREDKLEALAANVKAAFRLAQQAIEQEHADAIAVGDIGPIPEQGNADLQELLEEYGAIADALLDAGAEHIWFETFSDFEAILPIAERIKRKSDAYVHASFCLNKFGYTRSGLSAAGILETAAASGVIDGVGFNCGIGPAHMCQILRKLDFGDLVISANPNSGYPLMQRGRLDYEENVSYFAEQMEEIAHLGVNLLGGCCGTTPAYIQALSDARLGQGESPARKRAVFGVSAQSDVQKENNAFYKKLVSGKRMVLVELDPPHDGNGEKVVQASMMLKEAGVDALTFSDSPMGKMRADPVLTGAVIQREIGIPSMPHLSCRDRNRLALGASFFGAHLNGIRSLLLVTGDPVPQGLQSGVSSVFDFNSIRLMEYVRQMNLEHFRDDPFVYGGALNYGRSNLEKEIERVQRKCEAGADYFLTQPIFSAEDVERVALIEERTKARIFCGIMPLVSYRNANFMKNEVFGIHVPEEIVSRYGKDMSREEGERTGIAVALEIAAQLSGIGAGYYFMVPFNRASMICEIITEMRGQSLI